MDELRHHAYIYEGALSLLDGLAADAKARFGFGGEHNPDAHVRQFEKFGIEESRWMRSLGALRGTSGRSLYIIGISSITSEAQQALLKLFEEPQAGTTFVILVPHGVLLPTVRSRVAEYPEKLAGGAEGEAGGFLKMTGKARSDAIAKMLKDDEGVKERVREFLAGLENELAPRMNDANVREGLEDIAKVRDYLRDRSPALKMLLEHLALSLPKL